MIRIPSIEPEDQAWREWKIRAEEACQELIKSVESGSEPNIIGPIYKAQKALLLRMFHGKCAYCEVRLTGNQPGDVEHYRPKKDLTDEQLSPITDCNKQRHRGYYWLAYHWLNLLPSCIECNRSSTTPEGKPRGKRNRFPVRGFRAFKPQEEHQEEPLLLNPWLHNPEEHLKFDDELGLLAGITEEGVKTIEILDLNREGLQEGRQETQQHARGLLIRWTTAVIEGNSELAEKLADEIREYAAGAKPFSAVARVLIEHARNDLARI